jgi:hypothetical protein
MSIVLFREKRLLDGFFEKPLQEQISLYIKCLNPTTNAGYCLYSDMGLCTRHWLIIQHLSCVRGYDDSIWSKYPVFKYLVNDVGTSDMTLLVDKSLRGSYLSKSDKMWFTDGWRRMSFVRKLKARLCQSYLSEWVLFK